MPKKIAKKTAAKTAKKAPTAARKTAKKGAKKAVHASSAKAQRIGKLKFDKDLESYKGFCQLDGKKVEITIDASEGSVDLTTLTQIGERIIATWAKLHAELCQIARDEIISARFDSADDVPELKRSDVTPFLFSISADSDAEVWYSFGLNVSSLLDDDEYVDVSREVNGSWTNSEVCCSE